MGLVDAPKGPIGMAPPNCGHLIGLKWRGTPSSWSRWTVPGSLDPAKPGLGGLPPPGLPRPGVCLLRKDAGDMSPADQTRQGAARGSRRLHGRRRAANIEGGSQRPSEESWPSRGRVVCVRVCECGRVETGVTAGVTAPCMMISSRQSQVDKSRLQIHKQKQNGAARRTRSRVAAASSPPSTRHGLQHGLIRDASPSFLHPSRG